MKQILIIVDMQNDFIDGALGTKEAVAIVPKVEEVRFGILTARFSSQGILMRPGIWRHRKERIFRCLIASVARKAGRSGKNWML